MSHTPGPWSVRQNEWSRYEILYRTGILAVISKWDDPSSPPPIEQMNANARLIAAAPDLLEALENLIFTAQKLWDEVKPIKDSIAITVTHPMIEEARAAISRAKGA